MDSVGPTYPQLLIFRHHHGGHLCPGGPGFVTIARASQIINFAQGEFVMLGGVITFFFSWASGSPLPHRRPDGHPDRGRHHRLSHPSRVVYPLRKASALILIMATLGASIFLSNTSGLIFGTLPKALPPFSGEAPSR